MFTSKNQQKIQPIKASVIIQSNVDLQIMLWNKKRWEDIIFRTNFFSGNTGKVKSLDAKIYLCQSREINFPTSNCYLCSSLR